ncbi:MAG: hypothetical protein NC093_08730 [Alistipes sp.]|nr:hypothetical protein [Alistipes sp.]
MKMKKTAAILAAMAVITAAAFSCGKEEADTEKPELPELPGVTTSAGEETTETVTTEAATADKTEKPTEKATESTEPVTEAVTEADEVDEPSDEPDDEPSDEPDQPYNEPSPEPDQPDAGGVPMDYSVLDRNFSDFTSVYGEPQSSEVVQGCLSNGADQRVCYYDGMTVFCYIAGDGDRIYDVTIENGGYPLSSGISVGSSRGDVESVYGTGETKFERFVYYYSGSNSLSFEYDGDTVVSIDIYMPV